MPTDLTRVLARKDQAANDLRGSAFILPACLMIALLVIALSFEDRSVANSLQLLVIG